MKEEISTKKEQASKDSFTSCLNHMEKTVHPEILQTWELLKLNPSFKKDLKKLRTKWKIILEKDKFRKNKLASLLKNYYKENDIINPNFFDKLRAIKEDKNILKLTGNGAKYYFDKNIEKDFIKIALKYKLTPVNFWADVIRGLFFNYGFFNNPSFFNHFVQSLALENNNTPIVIPTGRFEIKITKDGRSREKRLSLNLFKGCSLRDIKDDWSCISNILKKLDIHQRGKRYYPLKNLSKFKKLKNLDKRPREESYYDFASGEEELLKYTDLEKAEEIYGEGAILKASRNKNKLKQMRCQYRKRTKS